MIEQTNITTKEKRFKTIIRMFTATVIVVLFILSIPLYVKYAVRNKIFTTLKNIEAREFAIVLGAGIKGNQTPGSYLKQRLNDVVTLYKNGKVKKILLSGDNSKVKHDEISVMNNYLLKNGVPQKVIFSDYAGFDTYSSMERAFKIFDIKEAIIVSQGFHLPRSVYIAQTKGIYALGFSTHANYGKKRYYIREWAATIKSFFDCVFHRKATFYGEKINTNNKSNVEQKQL
jgi:SanA protein